VPRRLVVRALIEGRDALLERGSGGGREGGPVGVGEPLGPEPRLPRVRSVGLESQITAELAERCLRLARILQDPRKPVCDRRREGIELGGFPKEDDRTVRVPQDRRLVRLGRQSLRLLLVRLGRSLGAHAHRDPGLAGTGGKVPLEREFLCSRDGKARTTSRRTAQRPEAIARRMYFTIWLERLFDFSGFNGGAS
jgi:hypothetical protein